jgi:hypothetical protein
MGIRGEIFSKKVLLQKRSYFFNVKENRNGDIYLNIVESKNKEEGGFERQSVVLFEDDLQDFLRGFDESLRVMEKSVREKRRVRPKERGQESERSSGAAEYKTDRAKTYRAKTDRAKTGRSKDGKPVKIFRKKRDETPFNRD